MRATDIPHVDMNAGAAKLELHGGVMPGYLIVSSPPFALFQAGGERPGRPALRGTGSSGGARSDTTYTSIRSRADIQKKR